MKIKERFLNTLDGILLALVMLWTITFATQLLHPSNAQPLSSNELHAPLHNATAADL